MFSPFTRLAILSIAILLAFLPAIAFAQVVISEVMWMGTDLGTSDEWLEFHNTGSGDVLLDRWRITSVNSSGQEVTIATFEPDDLLGSGSLLVVSRNGAAESRLLEEPGLVSPILTLPNTKLLLRLYDQSGVLIDTVDDGVGAPFAGANVQLPLWKASMERIESRQPGNISTNWRTASTFFGFDDGAPLFGTPGLMNGSGATVDVFPPHDAQNVMADVLDSGTGRVLALQWVPSLSLDLYAQVLTIEPVLPNGSGTVILPPTANGFITALDRSIAYRAFLYSHDTDGNISEGVEILIEPYLETEIDDSSTGSSSTSSAAVSSSSGAFFSSSTTSSTATSSASTSSCSANWSTQLRIQSGQPRAEEKVTINIELLSTDPPISKVRCAVDFGDGTQSSSCNPPSHSYTTPGPYLLSVEMANQCGTTVIHTLPIEVLVSQSSVLPTPPQVSASQSTAAPTSPETSSLPPAQLLLLAVLPNPDGTDTGKEWIEIRNIGSESSAIDRWSLKVADRTYALPPITLVPGEVRRLTRTDIPFSLTNTRGYVLLVAPDGTEQKIQWEKAGESKVYYSKPPVGKFVVQVVQIIDGDTLDVRFAALPKALSGDIHRARLIGIDAPEIKDANEAIRSYGLETKESLEALIKNKKIELEFDTDMKDTYGRILAYIYSDGALVQEKILKNGLASAPVEYPHSKFDMFKLFEQEAKQAKRGHWGTGEASVVLSGSSASSSSAPLLASTAEASPFLGDLELTEIYPSPDPGDDEWIELWNPTDHEIPLKGLIVDDTPVGGSKPHLVTENIVIAPTSFAAVRADIIGVALNNGGDYVHLTASGTVIASVEYPSIKTGFSYALVDGTWCITEEPTPDAANKCVVTSVAQKKAVAAKQTPAKKATVRYKAVTALTTSSKAHVTESGAFATVAASVLHQSSLPQGPKANRSQTIDIFLIAFFSSFIGGITSSYMFSRFV